MQKYSVFEDKIKVLCTLTKNFDFSKLSAIRIGPICRWHAVIHKTSSLISVLKLCKKFGVGYVVVGGASNILFCGDFFDGVVLQIGMKKITCRNNILSAYAGAKLGGVVNYCLKRNLSGLEKLVSIPATIGGAVAMNAGAFGAQISDVLKNVYVLNIKTFCVEKFSHLEYFPKHHQSVFTNNVNYVIIKADFCLMPKSNSVIKQTILECVQKRVATQKVGFPNLGSVFKRGELCLPPACLIEKSGLKGLCQGGAMVSLVHSGFIVNCGKATWQDVCVLLKRVQDVVLNKFGVIMEPEIIIIGDKNGSF